MSWILRSFIVVSILSCVGCSQSPVGSKSNPLKLMFIPYAESQTIITHTEGLVKFLEKSLSQKLLQQESGFYIKSSIPTSYVAVVESFGTGRADVAAMTTFSYLLTKDVKKYPVEAFLTVDRYPDGLKYRGAIIARADSKVKSVEDLKGKKFAYADPASTSGFILPAKLFKDKGIELAETMFAGRHDTVVMMVYQKQVDAGAIYYSSPEQRRENGKTTFHIRDARSMTLTQIPDVEKQIQIVGFTEEVPNEPWVIRTTIYQNPEEQERLKKALTESIIEFTSRPDGKNLMQVLVRAEKVVPVTDAFYDPVRDILKTLDLDAEKFVK